jgi:tripartite-type tricarboxylate transporter receptor subunit TctC
VDGGRAISFGPIYLLLKGVEPKLKEVGIMKESGRRALAILFVLFFSFLSVTAFSADFPAKPITLWVGYNPGGETDLSGRAISEAASKFLGQPVVVVNKPGGSGATMLSQLKTVKPDGYTLGVMTMGSLIASHMRKVPYVCSKDFLPIIHYGYYAAGFAVKSDAPWGSFEDFLKWAEEKPGMAKYSCVGSGSPQHLIMERIAIERKIKLTIVPYTSGHEAAMAILGGHVVGGSLGGDWIPFVKSGQLKCLLLLGGQRMKQFPNIPHIREFGFQFEFPNMIGIVGPNGIPEPIVKKLHEGFKKAMAEPVFEQALETHYMPIVYLNSEEFGRKIKEADEEQGALIRKLGLRKE